MTKIEWVKDSKTGEQGKTWNPVTGCSKVSTGCKNCFAESMAKRLKAMGRPEYQDAINGNGKWTGRVTLVSERLAQPLKREKPTTYFVNSMSDLFHEDVPDEFIYQVFARMILASQHTFQILTKRPRRTLDWFRTFRPESRTNNVEWPLKNVWLGVSIENQKTADERRDAFRQTPAAVKFVSYEPALGLVDWAGWEFIDWLIVGGESGPKARPMHPVRARGARNWATAAGVPFFFKQWGEWYPREWGDLIKLPKPRQDSQSRLGYFFGDEFHRGGSWEGKQNMACVGKKAAGRLLDGREYNEMPEVAR